MSERATGATLEQIEAAAIRCFDFESPMALRKAWADCQEWFRERRIAHMKWFARYLVPPGAAIVDRAFYARVLRAAKSDGRFDLDMHPGDWARIDAELARLGDAS